MRDQKKKGANESPLLDEKIPLRTIHYPKDLSSPPPGLDLLSHSEIFDSSGPPSLAVSDDDDDESDYDWSAEEDLVDEEAKFEQKIGVKKERNGCGFKRIITFLFSSLIGSTFLAALLVACPLIVHFLWYKKNPTPHRRYIMDNLEAWFWWAAANLVFSWCLALLIDLVPVVGLGTISIGWGHISEQVKNSIELYNTIKGTIKPSFYAATAWVSWVILFESIYQLYDPNNESQSYASYTPRVYEVVRFLFFFTLVISLQFMASHVMALAFHRTAFKERLETVSEALKTIEKLRQYKPPKGHNTKKATGTRTPLFAFSLTPFADKDKSNTATKSQYAVGLDLDREDGTQADVEDMIPVSKSNGKRKSGYQQTRNPPSHSDSTSPRHHPPDLHSDTPVRRRSIEGNDHETTAIVTQAAKVLKTAVLHDARNIKGKDDDTLVRNVTSAHEAKRLARLIYLAFHDRRRTYLVPSDFYPAFPTQEEAEAAFRVFDKDGNGDISRQEVKHTLLKVYKERRFLSRSMHDVGAALKTLDRLLLLIALIIIFFISLSVFGVNVNESLTSVYTIGIAGSFIFKNSASGAFDAIMFLFVTHPFDTGDRCFIGAENLVVKKMGLFATVFQRADGTETYYFNSQLFNMFITNARRSAKTFENVTIQVAWRTPLEKLDALITSMNEWLQTEENRWFEPSTSLTIQHIDFQRYMECTIVIGHNGNWQDWCLRLARKTAFHAAVQFYCRQLGIVAYASPIPVLYADNDGSPRSDNNATVSTPYETGEATSPVLPSPLTKEKSDFLGFKPPSSHTSSLRARKSRSRKAMLSSNMGDI